MASRLGSLRNDDIGSSIASPSCSFEILDLADELRTRGLDLRREWPLIAEGKHVTYDMKSRPDDPTAVGTSQVADEVARRLESAKV